jgi:hypothetical protein
LYRNVQLCREISGKSERFRSKSAGYSSGGLKWGRQQLESVAVRDGNFSFTRRLVKQQRDK